MSDIVDDIHVPFTGLLDLAAERLGGRVLLANDEFFAPKESLLHPGRGAFIADRFTDRGKWMDGWETRRRREPGHDWCIVQLAAPGRIHGVDVDTNHFLGNFPERASIDVAAVDADTDPQQLASADDQWREAVAPVALRGGARNLLPVAYDGPVTHVRLNIYPDGGVARLRVHGEVVPQIQQGQEMDLAAVLNGGSVPLCNDMFFGTKDNLIMPGSPENMGDGWETRRRRRPGHDWTVVKLAAPAQLSRIEIDTTHFKGNCPDCCTIEWCSLDAEQERRVDFCNDDPGWKPLVGRMSLEPHDSHTFGELAAHSHATHLRLNIFPDGGVARLRAFGHAHAGGGAA